MAVEVNAVEDVVVGVDAGDSLYFVSAARFAHSACCYLGEQRALIVRINYRIRIIREEEDENEEGEAERPLTDRCLCMLVDRPTSGRIAV